MPAREQTRIEKRQMHTRIKRARQTFIQRSRSKGAEEKAIYHNVSGAGKSHVKRVFFDLNKSDEDAIEAILVRGIDEAFK